MVVQSERALLVGTHWFGRTLLCPSQDCPGCLQQQAAVRALVVVSPVAESEPQGYLLEVGGATWAGVLAGVEALDVGPIRGAVLELVRTRRRGHLRAVARDRRADLLRGPLGSERRLVQAAACLYRLPQPRDDEPAHDWGLRVQPAVRAAVAAAVASL